MMHKEFTILEDIVVHSVPDGIRTTLEKGKSGIISQSLGDNYTIVVEGNMYQLSGIDGEKIGEEKRELSSNNFANEEEVWNVLHTCYDPEIPVNIYELGLIYKIEVIEENKVIIEMTLTSPNCPVAESLPNSVKENILKIEGINDVDLKLVWDPPWTKEKMSEAAKLELNL
jgi:probable FeS assembly SUF system protein SufT